MFDEQQLEELLLKRDGITVEQYVERLLNHCRDTAHILRRTAYNVRLLGGEVPRIKEIADRLIQAAKILELDDDGTTDG